MPDDPAPQRTVHCADALTWLREQPSFDACSFVTSLPDVSELGGMALDAWRRWFEDAAALVLSRCPPGGVAIFYQSDVRRDGVWIDKGHLVSRAAERDGHALLFHRVVCRRPPGTVTFGRVAYAHLLGFSRAVRLDPSWGEADVILHPGEPSWPRGMGLEVCRAACRFVLRHTASRTVVDPFCGRGAVLAAANALGLDAVGVELNAKRAHAAREAVDAGDGPGRRRRRPARAPTDGGSGDHG